MVAQYQPDSQQYDRINQEVGANGHVQVSLFNVADNVRLGRKIGNSKEGNQGGHGKGVALDNLEVPKPWCWRGSEIRDGPVANKLDCDDD